jgi:hypothetical protein
MRTSLTSGAVIEAAVTLAVAVLMTVAGFEMLHGVGDAAALAARSGPALRATSARQVAEKISTVTDRAWLPHVDIGDV